MTEPEKHTAFISLGSNMGDKRAFCENAVMALEASGAAVVTGHSPFYQTEPVDYTDQDWFVNAVIRVETALEPSALLAALHCIEKEAGRDRRGVIRFGPRTLDMDMILYDHLVLETPELTLPHPRMHKRRFVLQPLCDIDPEIIHPVLKKNMKSLLDQLDDPAQGIIPYVPEGRPDV